MKRENIKWNEIRTLIDRFYQGQTTHEEEALLMEVMCGKEVPEDLLTDAEVFRTLALEQAALTHEPHLPEGFEARLTARIRQEEQREKFTPKTRRMKRWWISAAACLLIAIAGILTPHHSRQPSEGDVFAASDLTQEEAEAYAIYALTMVSNSMKAGVQELECVGKAQQHIRQSLNETITY